MAQAATGRAALDQARVLCAGDGLDVAVLDLQMPEPDGIAVATELVALGVHSVIVTSHGRPGHLKRALAAGVRGFLPKTTEAARLAEVIRAVAGGGRYVDPELAAEAIGAGDSPLTPREADCLELAADGASIEDIAARAHLSPGHRAQLPVERDHQARRGQPARRLRDRRADGLDLAAAGQRIVARKSPIRPIASSSTDASGSVTRRKWSGSNQLKPVPWVTRIFFARSRSITNCWSSSIG